VDEIRHWDSFMVTADFDAYTEAQADVAADWVQPARWWRKSILNIAGAAWFSSDRTIREYAKDIWSINLAQSPHRSKNGQLVERTRNTLVRLTVANGGLML
jgi:starch phosphorylase